MANSMLASRVLFSYRTSPQGSTGLPPAELMLNLKPCTRLDLLFPMIADRIKKSQICQKETHDSKCHSLTFTLGQAVQRTSGKEENGYQVTLWRSKVQLLLTMNWKMADTGEDTRIMLDRVCQIAHMYSQVSTQNTLYWHQCFQSSCYRAWCCTAYRWRF